MEESNDEIENAAALCAVLMMLVISLTACGQSNNAAGGSSAPESSSTQSDAASTEETQTVNGIINRKGDFLVLLTDEGAYQVMELGEGVSLDEFTEGDSVKVTYTGELGNEEVSPVATSIEMTE